MITGREHEHREATSIGETDDDDWTILADVRCVLVGDPCPDNLAGIRSAVLPGAVLPADRARVVTRSPLRRSRFSGGVCHARRPGDYLLGRTRRGRLVADDLAGLEA